MVNDHTNGRFSPLRRAMELEHEIMVAIRGTKQGLEFVRTQPDVSTNEMGDALKIIDGTADEHRADARQEADELGIKELRETSLDFEQNVQIEIDFNYPGEGF